MTERPTGITVSKLKGTFLSPFLFFWENGEEDIMNNVSPALKPNTKKRPGIVSNIYDWVETFVLALVVFTLVFTFAVRQVMVDGESMVPTLQDGNRLIISDICYTPHTGDIVVVQANSIRADKPIIKRVIATGGQTVDIDFTTWKVTVDGKVLDEDYINYLDGKVMYNAGGCSYPYTVNEGCVFVMGDNRNNSNDSRFCGEIDEKYIIGKAYLRLFPFDEIGVL